MVAQRERTARQHIPTIDTYLAQLNSSIGELPLDRIAAVVELLDRARERGSRVFTFGNGGSAATASHIACDFAKGAAGGGRPGLKAIALTDNMPLVTAWANDTDYKNVFAAQVGWLVVPGDIVIGISGSGNSPNVLNGVTAGRIRGATTVGFCGFGGGELASLVDMAVVTDCRVMEQVEDIHLLLGHVLTTCLRWTEPQVVTIPASLPGEAKVPVAMAAAR
jgi:D-sedoheptulose 7-phosphate isomerase